MASMFTRGATIWPRFWLITNRTSTTPPNITIGSVNGVRTPRAYEWTIAMRPIEILASTTQVLTEYAAPAMPDQRSVPIARTANAVTAASSHRTVRRQPTPIKLATNIVIGALIV